MNQMIAEYLRSYPKEIQAMYEELRRLLYEHVPQEIDERLWAKLPSYYVGDRFVRLIPFKDHINVEAAAVLKHRDELAGYKLTPKGFLQLYLKQEIPHSILKAIFSETLS